MADPFIVPKIDYSWISQLPNQFAQGQQLGREDALRSAFANGIPMASDGSIDYPAMAKMFAQSGDPANAVKAAEAGAEYQLAVSKYNKPHYAMSPNGEIINENAMDPSQVVVSRGAGGGAPNPDYQYGKNPSQAKAATSATRASNANKILNGITQNPDTGYPTSGFASALPEGGLRTFLSTSKRSSFDAAATEFLDSIGENTSSGRTRYIPDFINDNPSRLAEKARLRDEAVHAKAGEAGPVFAFPGGNNAQSQQQEAAVSAPPPRSVPTMSVAPNGTMTPTQAGADVPIPPVPGVTNDPRGAYHGPLPEGTVITNGKQRLIKRNGQWTPYNAQ